MKKSIRCVLLGAPKVGKSSLLMSLDMVESALSQPYVPTLEDTHWFQTASDSGDRAREFIVFHDTGGLQPNFELRRALMQIGDCFVIVFSVLDNDSFVLVDSIKKYLDRNPLKDKKDFNIILIGTHIDLPGRQVSPEMAQQWATREKVRYFELSSGDRNALTEVIHYIVGRHFHNSKDSKFSLSKKLKPEKSNTQILMDF